MLALLTTFLCVSSLPPGAVVLHGVSTSCALGNSTNNTYCFTGTGHPTTLCRVTEPQCAATGERVASHLRLAADESTNCTTANWTWTCTTLTLAPTRAPTAAPSFVPTTTTTTTNTQLAVQSDPDDDDGHRVWILWTGIAFVVLLLIVTAWRFCHRSDRVVPIGTSRSVANTMYTA